MPLVASYDLTTQEQEVDMQEPAPDSQAAVTSPLAHTTCVTMVGEASVPPGLAPGGGGTGYIPLQAAEPSAAQEPEGYWQRRGKSSAAAEIKKFMLTGTARWK